MEWPPKPVADGYGRTYGRHFVYTCSDEAFIEACLYDRRNMPGSITWELTVSAHRNPHDSGLRDDMFLLRMMEHTETPMDIMRLAYLNSGGMASAVAEVLSKHGFSSRAYYESQDRR